MRLHYQYLSINQGFILLPVVLTLMILSTVAYLLSSEGAYNAGNVNRENEQALALYVAQAGYNAAKWQLNRSNCTAYTDISTTVFGNQSYLAEFTDSTGNKLTAGSPANIKVVGTLANGTTYTITRFREKIYQNSETSLVLQPGIDSVDTFLDAFKSSWNNGSHDLLRVQGGSKAKHSLLKFDLSGIPQYAKLTKATLELFLSGKNGSSDSVSVHRMTADWVEGNSSGGSGPGSTWIESDTGISWTTAGGDYESVASESQPIVITQNNWQAWNVLNLVSDWVKGIYPNYGLILLPESTSVFNDFNSGDSLTPSLLPKLTITYVCECGQACGGVVLPPAKKIYWTDDVAETIQRSDEDGSNVETVITGQFKVRGLDIDTINGKIYWSSDSFIKRADLDGSNIETIFTTTTELNFDVKLDVAGGKMYWTYDNASNAVLRANLDGSSVETINTSTSEPVYFSLDTTAAYLYVTEYGNNNISRMKLDGSATTTLVTGSGTGNIGNALDTVNGKIYWTGGSTNDWIKRANLDGSNEETIISGQNAPQDIVYDVDNDRIYWTDGIDIVIRRANADGTNIETIVSTGERPRGITIVNAEDVPSTLPSTCNGNFLDSFNAVSFAANDGTLSWASNWQEVGESDGAGAGDIRVRNDISDYQLRLRDNDNGGEGVARAADLSAASSATLNLDYRRSGLDNSSDYVTVEISSTGTAGPWVERGRFSGPGNDSNYVSWSYNFDTTELSANTAIRLRTSSSMGGKDNIYFDNIEIQCLP